jgi:hypothetical protein
MAGARFHPRGHSLPPAPISSRSAEQTTSAPLAARPSRAPPRSTPNHEAEVAGAAPVAGGADQVDGVVEDLDAVLPQRGGEIVEVEQQGGVARRVALAGCLLSR